MDRRVTFEALHNVRDLGGLVGKDGRRVKGGLLYRSDQPFFASNADKAKIAGLGVLKMVDLRSRAEHEDKPDPEIPGVENVYLPIIEDVRAGITHGERENASITQMLMSGSKVDASFVDDYMGNMYRQFITDPFANAQYARFIDEAIACAQAGKGVMWHCTAGKDRAGFAAAIILEALGASRDDILTDYLLTNDCLRGFTQGMLRKAADRLPSDEAKALVARFFSADEAFLGAAYAQADESYGGFEGYLEQALGIDGAKREFMQSLMLEP